MFIKSSKNTLTQLGTVRETDIINLDNVMQIVFRNNGIDPDGRPQYQIIFYLVHNRESIWSYTDQRAWKVECTRVKTATGV